MSSFFGTQLLETRKCQLRKAQENTSRRYTLGYASFLRSGFGEFLMSNIGVVSVALASSPILFHLVKRFLPLKPEPKQSVTNHFHAPVYQLNLPPEPPAELVRLLIDKAQIQTATKTAIQGKPRK
jgi:hypothetical protein